MKRPILAILAIILGVALCWAAPPVDNLPSLLPTPAEARITSVIVGGSPTPPAGGTCGTTKAYVASSYRSGRSSGSDYVTSVATSSTVNIGAGELVVAIVGSGYNNSYTVSSVSDGTNTFVYGDRQTTTGGDIEIWYVKNATAVVGATITASWGSNEVQYALIQTAQFTGQYTTDPLPADQIGKVSTSGTALTTSNVTTACNDVALVYGFTLWDVADHSAASGYTLLSPSSSQDYSMLYKLVTSTGTYPSGTVDTISTSLQHVGISGAFR